MNIKAKIKLIRKKHNMQRRCITQLIAISKDHPINKCVLVTYWQPAEVIEQEQKLIYGLKANTYVFHDWLMAALTSSQGCTFSELEDMTTASGPVGVTVAFSSVGIAKKITGGGVDHTRPKSCESTICYDQHQWTNPLSSPPLNYCDKLYGPTKCCETQQ